MLYDRGDMTRLMLVRRGEKPRPICVGCKKPGDQGAVVGPGDIHICKVCLRGLDRGIGIQIDQEDLPDQRAM